MNQKILVTDVQYVDPAYEAVLEELKNNLISLVRLQGKQDGTGNLPTTPEEYRARILNLIEVKIQSAIDQNQQRYLPISGAVAAKMFEIEADKEDLEVRNAMNDDEHALSLAEREANHLRPDTKMIGIRKAIFVGLIFIAVTEGFLSYSGFRHANFMIVSSVIACAVVAIAAGVGSHYGGGFIKEAKSRWQRIVRYVITLIPAVIGFSVLAHFRARALNHVSTLEIGSSHVTPHGQDTGMAVGIAVISLVLYFVAVFLSSHFFRTREEREREHQYEQICVRIAELRLGIGEKIESIKGIRKKKGEEMSLAIKRFEYARDMESLLINFAQELVEEYKQKNMRLRTDGCPDFFCHKPVFHFIRFFDNVKPQKNEAA